MEPARAAALRLLEVMPEFNVEKITWFPYAQRDVVVGMAEAARSAGIPG